MEKKFKSILLVGLLTIMLLGFNTGASALPINVGEYNTSQCCGNGQDGVQRTVDNVGGSLVYTGQDNSPTILNNDIIIAGNWNNMFTPWIAGGGVFILHDWNSQASSLPGMGRATKISYASFDVNVIDPLHPIVSGPFGTINNTIMDDGFFSINSAWYQFSLNSLDPLVNSVNAFLSSEYIDHVACFDYVYGSGHVIYAAMPLEAYTQTVPFFKTPNVPGAILYANNELAYAASLVDASVPEPGTLVLMGLGLAGLGFSRKRKPA